MFEKLTISHSLYVIDIDLLHEFQAIAQNMKLPVNIEKTLSMRAVDNAAVIFNTWLLLFENPLHLFYHSHKMMIHACNYYCLDILRKQKLIQDFNIRYPLDKKRGFALAMFLGYEILQWIYELLSNSLKGQQIMQLNEKRDYFQISEHNATLIDDATHEIYAEQKYMIHLLAKNISQTNAFDRLMDKAIHNTTSYWRKMPSSINKRFMFGL